LKTLRAKERIPQIRPGNTRYDGLYRVPTLQEVINLARWASNRYGRPIGIYPETKHPTYFESIGLPLEEPLVRTLHRNGYRGLNAPVFIQSFEVGNLKRLRRMTDLPLVQLLSDSGKPYDFVVSGDPRTYADLATPEGLAEIATYAQGIGPSKNLVIPRDASGNLTAPTALIGDAHSAGLLVHAYTFRAENSFLPANLRRGNPADPVYPAYYGDMKSEVKAFLQAGLDGFFTDHPDLGVEIRNSLFGRAPVPSEEDYTNDGR
jgi:glycerophosphoryl diester phosphodiesterase